MSRPEALFFDNISFAYSGVEALTDITFSINRNDFAGLVGPNGGGKTTLIKLALGLLKPDKGRVTVFGAAPEKGRGDVGYVPQRFSFHRDFPISVKEMVLMGRIGVGRLSIRYSVEDKIAADNAMEQAEVIDLSKRPVSSLSGGQLQRALIARALATDPKLLILDEPTANVDLKAERTLFDLLKQLNENMTIVVVSHDIGFISQYISTVACLNKTLVCHETTDAGGDIIEKMYGAPMASIDHHTHIPQANRPDDY